MQHISPWAPLAISHLIDSTTATWYFILIWSSPNNGVYWHFMLTYVTHVQPLSLLYLFGNVIPTTVGSFTHHDCFSHTAPSWVHYFYTVFPAAMSVSARSLPLENRTFAMQSNASKGGWRVWTALETILIDSLWPSTWSLSRSVSLLDTLTVSPSENFSSSWIWGLWRPCEKT